MLHSSRLSLLALLLLLPLALAANASSRLQKLQRLSSKSSDRIIRLNSALYEEFTAVPAGERDYALSVVLTALKPAYNCVQCREFDTQYGMVATQWHRSAKSETPTFFASLDFPDGQEVFRKLALTTAPVLKYFHPVSPETKGKPQEDAYSFSSGLGAPHFASWMVATSRTPVSFRYRQPVDYAKIATYVFTFLAICITFYRHWTTLSPLITGSHIWAFLSIAFILTMTSGYMWNQIRHPPYMVGGSQGKPVSMIASGYQNQYGVETHIISGVYGALALSVVIILLVLPKVKSPQAQRVGIYLWVGVIIVMHAVLTGLFKVKSPGYPYGLFL